MGGTVTILIIKEYTAAPETTIAVENHPQVVVFSAKNNDRLQAVIEQMTEFVEREEQVALSNLAYTLQAGREAMDYRLAMVVVNDREELLQGEAVRTIALPTYPFEKRRCWIDATPESKGVELVRSLGNEFVPANSVKTPATTAMVTTETDEITRKSN